jgi:hypothetical protein
MFDDICECLFYSFVVIALFVWGCYVGYVNTKPKEIKDTNCIYYEEQIYCLQENEGEK